MVRPAHTEGAISFLFDSLFLRATASRWGGAEQGEDLVSQPASQQHETSQWMQRWPHPLDTDGQAHKG